MTTATARTVSRVAAGLTAQLLFGVAVAAAQIPQSEFGARRDSLAARIDSGVVIAFGGRTPITDFGPFFQLPAFHYLTNFDEPDAAFVMVVRGGRVTNLLFTTPIEPRRALYYGRRPDSAAIRSRLGLTTRQIATLSAIADSLADTGLPFYSLADVEDADFARQDSLTRGQSFVSGLRARHAALVVKDAHPIVDQLRARKSAAELALIRKAAEVSAAGHLAAMQAPMPRKK